MNRCKYLVTKQAGLGIVRLLLREYEKIFLENSQPDVRIDADFNLVTKPPLFTFWAGNRELNSESYRLGRIETEIVKVGRDSLDRMIHASPEDVADQLQRAE